MAVSLLNTTAQLTAKRMALIDSANPGHLLFTDNTYDIGASGATRPRDLFLSRNLTIGGIINATAQPRCMAWNNAAQSVNDSAQTALTLNSEDYDVGALHDTGSNTERITIPTGGDGLYMIVGTASIAANATGQRQFRLIKNAATILAIDVRAGHASYYTACRAVEIVNLVATDYIWLALYQDSGGALNVGDGSRYYATSLQVVKLW